jgi:hypothetical protein
VLGDPQYVSGLEVPNIIADEVEISASLWRYPSGAETVTALRLRFGEPLGGGDHRKIGEVGIDSAKLVVADKRDIEEHWTETGKDRIGVVSTAPDDTVLGLLTKRFNLRTDRVNAVRAEVIGPVSEHLEAEIESFLKADPRYANYPFLHFYVQTNNSFDRAISISELGSSFLWETARNPRCLSVGLAVGMVAMSSRVSLMVTFPGY